jgi:hypothetical protein
LKQGQSTVDYRKSSVPGCDFHQFAYRPNVIGEGLIDWMDSRGFGSIGALRCKLSASRLADPDAYLRAQYIRILTGYARAAT